MGQCASSRRKIHREEFSDDGGSVDLQRHGCFAMVKGAEVQILYC